MESLESKLDRLSPEQRKETEDFIDFLLSRSGMAYTPMNASGNLPPIHCVAPPPLSLIEPVRDGEPGPARLQDPARTTEPAAPAVGEEVPPAPFQEIGEGIQDRITHDYMDYGQFEQHPSPATEAVKNVKRKLIAREDQDKPRHLLDWVD
jgi:hypothetical protein